MVNSGRFQAAHLGFRHRDPGCDEGRRPGWGTWRFVACSRMSPRYLPAPPSTRPRTRATRSRCADPGARSRAAESC